VRAAWHLICNSSIVMGVGTALFGLVSYAYAFYTVLLAIAFLINLKALVNHPLVSLLFPYTIDGVNQFAVSSTMTAFLVDNGVLGLFAIPHSLFARPAVKKAIGMPALYRSAYNFVTAITLHIICAYWQPLNPSVLWDVKGPALYIGYGFGTCFMLTATFAIDHFHLFGLTQSMGIDFNSYILRLIGVKVEEGKITKFLHYKMVRHPIMTGFFIMFFCVPTMTVTHMFFSLGASAYILLAVFLLEEPDLIAELGDEYLSYKNEVPAFCPCAVCGKNPSSGMY